MNSDLRGVGLLYWRVHLLFLFSNGYNILIMRYLLASIFYLAIFTALYSQAPNIRVQYESHKEYLEAMWERIDEKNRAIVKNTLLKDKSGSRHEYVRLNHRSKYEMLPEQEQPPKPPNLVLQGGVDGAYTCIDYEHRMIQKIRMFGSIFLLEDSLPKYEWVLEDRTKSILGHECYAAYIAEPDFMRGTDTVRAWFSPDIPIDGGPDMLSGLPGMILEANLINETSIIRDRAYLIELNQVTEESVQQKKIEYKRKITLEEYCLKIKS